MRVVKLRITGVPVAKGRPRATRVGEKGVRMYSPAKTAAYEMKMKGAWENTFTPGKLPAPHEGPVGLLIWAYFPIPKSKPKWWRYLAEEERLYVTTRPDGDNLAKICQDALDGIAWKDDAQIVDLNVIKMYSKNPRCEMRIELRDEVRRET